MLRLVVVVVEEEVFITSGNWRGKHNSLGRREGGGGESFNQSEEINLKR